MKYIIGAAMTLTTLSGVCMAESAETLQKQADVLREEGKTLDALNLYNQALVNYVQKHDYHGILSVLSGRLISWQHLFNHEEDKVYAILARKEAESMLAIAQEHDIHDRDYLIHFLFGKSCLFLKDFNCAEMEFKKAIELFPLDNAEKGDWLAHLGEAIYRNGRKEEGERIILEGVQQIQAHTNDYDSFRINVWISGAYLRLAKILINDNKIEQAKIYLQKGEGIVLNDSRLVIRKQQLEILKKKFDK
jgi:tetratricopeptide (TPR) repeat protein